MKCPQCGFVNSSQTAVCERCGHHLTPNEYPLEAPDSTPGPSILDAPLLATPKEGLAGPASEVPIERPGQPWQDEIAERVARYRRRKSRVQGTEGKGSSNLEFNFERDREIEAGSTAARRAPSEDEFDAVLGGETDSRAQVPELESIPIARSLPSIQAQAGAAWPAEQAGADVAGPAPLEIVLGHDLPEEEQPEPMASDGVRLAAPIGRRLAAGLVDALVLLIAACVFILVFAKTGGEVAPQASEVTVVILGLGAASLAAFYFALFTALAFATPGQSAVGLRVRTLDNRLPGTSAAMWRGAGYLVSAAALMLGFIWAVFDSQGLTWHDHMSGTCLVLPRNVTVDS